MDLRFYPLCTGGVNPVRAATVGEEPIPVRMRINYNHAEPSCGEVCPTGQDDHFCYE